MSAPWDQRLANDATMVEKCMSLGAVILKPPSKRSTGFVAPTPEELEEARADFERKRR